MTAPAQNLRINPERLWDSLMEMAKIGPGVAGGNNRQTLTDFDSAGRHLFQDWCKAAGCTMGLDHAVTSASEVTKKVIDSVDPLANPTSSSTTVPSTSTFLVVHFALRADVLPTSRACLIHCSPALQALTPGTSSALRSQ